MRTFLDVLAAIPETPIEPPVAAMAQVLADWFPRIAPIHGRPAPLPDEELRLLREMDGRVLEFGTKHDVGEFREAVTYWSHRLGSPEQVRAVIQRFSDPGWLDAHLRTLTQDGGNAGGGVRYIPIVLEQAGLISGRATAE